jgi:hypothetical protein
MGPYLRLAKLLAQARKISMLPPELPEWGRINGLPGPQR